MAKTPVKAEFIGATPEDIRASVERLGKLPVSAINGPVRKSATQTKRAAKGIAPVCTGALRRGIKVRPKKERSRTTGKVVYDLWMDPGMNDVFVKRSAAGKRAYYPASMEYGFKTVSGGRVEGHYYMKTAAEELAAEHEQFLLDEVCKKLDALWEKNGGGTT